MNKGGEKIRGKEERCGRGGKNPRLLKRCCNHFQELIFRKERESQRKKKPLDSFELQTRGGREETEGGGIH